MRPRTLHRGDPVRSGGAEVILNPALNLPPGFPRAVSAFVCDLDRTLIAEDCLLRPRTLAAIGAAQVAGIPVLIATGRMFRSVRPYLEQAGIREAVVCYQGAVIADPVSGRFLRHEPIPLALAREALAALAAEGVHVNCYVDDELYVAEVSEEAIAYAGFQTIPLHEVGDLLGWLAAPPTKLVAVGGAELLDALAVRLRERFAGRLEIAKSLPTFLELASLGVTKGAALRLLAAQVGFDPGRAVAFGDGENDVELVSCAGYGVAVANADARVLAVADWVCPPADEEGVAQVIEAYLHCR